MTDLKVQPGDSLGEGTPVPKMHIEPADLEADLIVAGARAGGCRWLLDELEPADFVHQRTLFSAVLVAHRAGGMGHLDEWAAERLEVLADDAGLQVVVAPRHAVDQLRDLRARRDLAIELEQLLSDLIVGADPQPAAVARVRDLLEVVA